MLNWVAEMGRSIKKVENHWFRLKAVVEKACVKRNLHYAFTTIRFSLAFFANAFGMNQAKKLKYFN